MFQASNPELKSVLHDQLFLEDKLILSHDRGDCRYNGVLQLREVDGLLLGGGVFGGTLVEEVLQNRNLVEKDLERDLVLLVDQEVFA